MLLTQLFWPEFRKSDSQPSSFESSEISGAVHLWTIRRQVSAKGDRWKHGRIREQTGELKSIDIELNHNAYIYAESKAYIRR